MAQFLKKSETVNAVRWSGRKRDIEDVFAIVNGLVEVIGLTATNELRINPIGAAPRVELQPGDWLIRDNGRLSAMRHDAFLAAFDPIP